VTDDLIALLSRERDRLVLEWARSLVRLFPAFAHRSPADLSASGRRAVDEFLRYLQTGDPAVLRTLVSDETVARLLHEVDLADVQRCFMVLRDEAARLLSAAEDATERARGFERLIAATDLVVVELARRQQAVRGGPVHAAPRQDLEERLALETRRALRFRRPLTLLLIQVDDYEEMARLYTSTLVEAAARAVADIIARLTREVDVRVPLGEGTFALLLLETDLKDGRWIAERVRVAAQTREGLERALIDANLTVSAGLAAFPLHADNAPALLQAAEDSLRHARSLGGNTVVVIDELPSGERVP
jgi:diguanylate cyclase (GGDEF)-like protein